MKRTCEDTPFVQVLPGSRSPCVKVRARYDFAVTLADGAMRRSGCTRDTGGCTRTARCFYARTCRRGRRRCAWRSRGGKDKQQCRRSRSLISERSFTVLVLLEYLLGESTLAIRADIGNVPASASSSSRSAYMEEPQSGHFLPRAIGSSASRVGEQLRTFGRSRTRGSRTGLAVMISCHRCVASDDSNNYVLPIWRHSIRGRLGKLAANSWSRKLFYM